MVSSHLSNAHLVSDSCLGMNHSSHHAIGRPVSCVLFSVRNQCLSIFICQCEYNKIPLSRGTNRAQFSLNTRSLQDVDPLHYESWMCGILKLVYRCYRLKGAKGAISFCFIQSSKVSEIIRGQSVKTRLQMQIACTPYMICSPSLVNTRNPVVFVWGQREPGVHIRARTLLSTMVSL